MDFRHKYRRPKAGVLLLDPAEERILLVQSRGFKWGPPKGTMEVEDATTVECALRELKEETGITEAEERLTFYARISHATYYAIACTPPAIDLTATDPDITGYAWIRAECARDLNLNSHCKQLLNKLENNKFFFTTTND